MNINENDVAKLVQQVLQEMTSGAPASAPKAQAAPSGDIPKTAKVAMMTELKHFEIQEYPIPELGDDDILADPVKQAHAIVFFQLPHRQAHRRLGQIQAFGRFGDPTFFAYRGKNAEMAQRHGFSPFLPDFHFIIGHHRFFCKAAWRRLRQNRPRARRGGKRRRAGVRIYFSRPRKVKSSISLVKNSRAKLTADSVRGMVRSFSRQENTGARAFWAKRMQSPALQNWQKRKFTATKISNR